MGVVVNATLRSLYSWDRHLVPIVQEAGWASGPVRKGAKNLAATGSRSPDRPAHSESLYRLHYPGPLQKCEGEFIYGLSTITWRRGCGGTAPHILY